MIFDGIEGSNRAPNALKYFREEIPSFHLAAAGSLLSVKLSGAGAYPVGKDNLLNVFPMTFLEFLDAIGDLRYWQLLEDIDHFTPFSELLHRNLIEHFRTYFLPAVCLGRYLIFQKQKTTLRCWRSIRRLLMHTAWILRDIRLRLISRNAHKYATRSRNNWLESIRSFYFPL